MRQLVRILVVDDHATLRRSVCALLRADPDFDVVCDVADGIQAVERAEELQPDVVVLDITMPGMDGFEAARRVRKVAPTASDVKVMDIWTKRQNTLRFLAVAQVAVAQFRSNLGTGDYPK